MGTKNCKDEKKKEADTFKAQSDSFGELYYANKDFIKAGEDYYKYCDPEKFKKLSGNKLEGAQNACDDAREVFGNAIERYEEASTKYKKSEEQHDNASQALSDCEHKKNKGKK